MDDVYQDLSNYTSPKEEEDANRFLFEDESTKHLGLDLDKVKREETEGFSNQWSAAGQILTFYRFYADILDGDYVLSVFNEDGTGGLAVRVVLEVETPVLLRRIKRNIQAKCIAQKAR